jgi:hypothetical protein
VQFFRFRLSLAWGLVWLGVVLAALSLGARVRLESAPSPVEIALEWGDAARLSSAERVPLARWLGAMRKRGARGVTLDVQSVRDLSEQGRLALWGRAAATPFFPSVARLPASYGFVVSCRDAALFARVRDSLRAQSRALPVVDVAPGVVAVALAPASLSAWPVGLDPLALEQLRAAKMEPLARLGDWTGATPARLDAVLKEVRADGARVVVAGDPSPGNQTLLPAFARSLRQNGLSLAWVEADTARGTPELARQTEGFLVRAHAVPVLDVLRLEPGAIVDRFARAARERGVRLFLVRIPRGLSGEADARTGAWKRGAFAQQLDFVADLERETRENRWARAGRPTLPVGLAKRFGVGNRSPRRAALARFAANIGTVGATLLVLALFVPMSPRAMRRVAWGGLGALALLSPFAGFGAQILALVASLTFPVVALAWSGAGNRSGAGNNRLNIRRASANRTRREAVFHATQVLFRATGLSLAGGLVVAATLDDWTYWTKVSDFWGTKAASIAPVVLVLVLLVGEFWPRTDPARGWVRVRRRLKVLGRRAFPLRDVALSLAAIGVVALWLARSGNDSGVGVSDFEWKFRALLETVFVARPRTKEFLLCHPALLLGALCLLGRKRHFAWPLLLLGTIGQISVVNSFAQANNPLYVPLWRTLLSLVLGGAFGALLSWAWAPRLGFARDPKRWRGWRGVRRLVVATSALAVVFSGVRWAGLRRCYAQLIVPSQNTTWPWKNARRETLRRGVTHWTSQLDDGTTLDLLEFDWKTNPRLRLGLWDADLESSPDQSKPRNRFGYWQNGFASQAARMNARGDLVACWNGGFFGLLNRKPRGADRAFHLSPVVVKGRAFYPGANHRWTWGAQTRGAMPQFKLQHEPAFASLGRDFDCASGTLQALILHGQALELRPYPWFGARPQRPPVPSTPREAGHIPTLDWMHTSRASAGWNEAGQLWVLLVKEPDGEAPSRALVGRRERGHGGWTLADTQRFWLSFGARNAVGFDGGDVLQSAWKLPDGHFEILAPRIALAPWQSATLRLQSDGRFQDPRVRALNGSALSYFFVSEEPVGASRGSHQR